LKGVALKTNLKPKQKGTDVMKSIVTILSILSLALFASCGGGEEASEDSNETETNATE